MTVIDSHFHLWALGTAGHQWPTPAEAKIHRDFGIADLEKAVREVPLLGGVAVQSQPTDADTDWLLETTASNPLVKAVVGWADLVAPTAAGRVAELAGASKIRGLRPMLQSIADTAWLLRDDVAPALTAMCDHGLSLDALVQPRHLPMLRHFVERWPSLPIIIDHGAKPIIREGEIDPWRREMDALSNQGVFCKLSGLRTEQAEGADADALHAYALHLVETFDDRLLWGSDWPVLLLSGDDYVDWYRWSRDFANAAGADLTSLFGGAAARFYRLELEP